MRSGGGLVARHRYRCLGSLHQARGNLWVPRMSSGPLSWTFVGMGLATKLGHGAVVPLSGVRPNPPVTPAPRRDSDRTGDRSRHAPSRGGGAASAGGPPGAAAPRPGVARRAESAPRPAASGQVLRPARDTAPLASRPGPAPVDLSPPLGSTERSRRHRRDRPPHGEGEPHLGISQDPR